MWFPTRQLPSVSNWWSAPFLGCDNSFSMPLSWWNPWQQLNNKCKISVCRPKMSASQRPKQSPCGSYSSISVHHSLFKIKHKNIPAKRKINLQTRWDSSLQKELIKNKRALFRNVNQHFTCISHQRNSLSPMNVFPEWNQQNKTVANTSSQKHVSRHVFNSSKKTSKEKKKYVQVWRLPAESCNAKLPK